MIDIRLTVNGETVTEAVEPRLTLVDFVREALGLTGTHVGCEHGVCGACTVLVDGDPVRSCLMLAVQVDGRAVTTVEGLAREDHQGGDEGDQPAQEQRVTALDQPGHDHRACRWFTGK